MTTHHPLISLKDLCAKDGTPYFELSLPESYHTTTPTVARDLTSIQIFDLRAAHVYCGLAQDVVMFGHALVHTRDGQFVFEGQCHQSHDLEDFNKTAHTFITARQTPAFQDYVEEECLFFGGPVDNPPNFGHFMFEFLPRLAVFDFCGLLGKFPVAVYDHFPERWLDFLELLGVPRSRIIKIPARESPAFRKVWVSSACNYRDRNAVTRTWPAGLYWLRERMLKSVLPNIRDKKLIYIGRQNVTWRRITNEPELIAFLEGYGFDCSPMESLSPRAQIACISRAAVVVAAEGAGTILTQFAPHHCIIILLSPRAIGGLWGGRGAAMTLGQTYKWIQCSEQSEQSELNADFSVDTAMLKGHIDLALAMIARGLGQ